MSRFIFHVLAVGFLTFASVSPALAEQASKSQDAGTAALTAGEVRKVDKTAKKITIRHGPIVNLDMPAMTMAFPVADPALLDRAKPGDKILFAAEKVGGTITVTRIEKSQ